MSFTGVLLACSIRTFACHGVVISFVFLHFSPTALSYPTHVHLYQLIHFPTAPAISHRHPTFPLDQPASPRTCPLHAHPHSNIYSYTHHLVFRRRVGYSNPRLSSPPIHSSPDTRQTVANNN